MNMSPERQKKITLEIVENLKNSGISPNLFTANESANFIFKVRNIEPNKTSEINTINTKTKTIYPIKTIKDLSAEICFKRTENEIFSHNLTMIDSQMSLIVAEMLKGYYFHSIENISDLVKYVAETNPLKTNETFYSHKIKELLCAFAIGMNSTIEWEDKDTNRYVVEKLTGEMLEYYMYNIKSFKAYLLNNTALSHSSTFPNGFVYEENGDIFIKLNLQIKLL